MIRAGQSASASVLSLAGRSALFTHPATRAFETSDFGATGDFGAAGADELLSAASMERASAATEISGALSALVSTT